MDYEASLQRAIDASPDLTADHDRLTVPDPSAQRDGAFTRFTNLGDVAEALARDAEQIHSVIQRELGTAGQFEGDWARYNGSFSAADLQTALDRYVEVYVTCTECGLPDTELVTENRNTMLRCAACGAFRPVAKQPAKSSSSTVTEQPDAIEEGTTYELEVTGTGRKGDGTAERGKYTIFIEGAREGETVRAYVKSVSGTLAFAQKR
ncbi:translation initiation factor IF-2 subunit beta [Halospeciosus flavus]|uniref:Translation initiation factor IF-2 subunit beta n=1 Tax=Halospeciosus flavus TaxID=3032283 RepID=A0ABD5Z6C1_9EURY|nr:translation initiation factor IF-2 subunit beta [Halospeciosus flavus]